MVESIRESAGRRRSTAWYLAGVCVLVVTVVMIGGASVAAMAQQVTTTTMPMGGTVSGTVTGVDNGVHVGPIEGACVYITDGPSVPLGQAMTDSAGKYSFSSLYTGDLWVHLDDCGADPARFVTPAPVSGLVIFGGQDLTVDWVVTMQSTPSTTAPTTTTTPGELPRTGVSVTAVVVAGLVCCALGLAALAASRQRDGGS